MLLRAYKEKYVSAVRFEPLYTPDILPFNQIMFIIYFNYALKILNRHISNPNIIWIVDVSALGTH